MTKTKDTPFPKEKSRHPSGGQMSKVVGWIWRVPSRVVVDTLPVDIENNTRGIRTGDYAQGVHCFGTVHKGRFYVIVIGFGFMFNPNFMAACSTSVQKHGAIPLTEQERNTKNELITWAHKKLVKIEKQERKQKRLLQ